MDSLPYHFMHLIIIEEGDCMRSRDGTTVLRDERVTVEGKREGEREGLTLSVLIEGEMNENPLKSS